MNPRKILFATMLIFLSPSALPQEIPKGTNQVIVRNANKEKAKSALSARGYSVTDGGLGAIRTVPRKTQSKGTIIITISFKDGDAIISGTFEGQTITPELFKFKESRAGLYLGGTFDSLRTVAREMGGEISYARN